MPVHHRKRKMNGKKKKGGMKPCLTAKQKKLLKHFKLQFVRKTDLVDNAKTY